MNKSIQAGVPATVSALANASGGIDAGNFVESEIDEQLFRFNSDDTPLMNLMLRAKRVKVNSPEVDHFMIDEPIASLRTTSSVNSPSQSQVILPLESNQQNIARPYSTLLVHGVDGYAEDGTTLTPGKWLMLFVVDHDRLPTILSCAPSTVPAKIRRTS